jgi:hypothetical protein
VQQDVVRRAGRDVGLGLTGGRMNGVRMLDVKICSTVVTAVAHKLQRRAGLAVQVRAVQTGRDRVNAREYGVVCVCGEMLGPARALLRGRALLSDGGAKLLRGSNTKAGKEQGREAALVVVTTGDLATRRRDGLERNGTSVT